MEHQITFIESGSWKTRITVGEGGEIKNRERLDEQTDMIVRADCSCGKTFLDPDKAWEHIEEIKDENSSTEE